MLNNRNNKYEIGLGTLRLIVNYNIIKNIIQKEEMLCF